MPLPASGTAWPPADLAKITPALKEWDAWWVGNIDTLTTVYQGAAGRKVHAAQYNGGISGALARFFWGRPPAAGGAQNPRQLHVPIGTDICSASSALLWSEAPTITVGDPITSETDDGKTSTEANPTQQRLEELLDDSTYAVLAAGSEAGAALGGHFLRVTWDPQTVPDRPFITRVDADAAWPEFRFGRLRAVTFWWVVKEDGQERWRHLERHELDEQGNDVVLHALYRGGVDNLGTVVPLDEVPATAGLQPETSSATPGLAVVYVPNIGPQRRWRSHHLGANLGRSDLDGIEGLMDALDEVYSSWMRDIRLAKARILAAESLLESDGAGQGAVLDIDREVFATVRALPSREASGLPIEAVQFAIRHEEHRATAEALVEQILRTAGYSPGTFGIGQDGVAMTATEVAARQQRTLLTRDAKLRHVRPAIADLLEKLLHVDRAVFQTPNIDPQRPDVEFPDGVQDSILTLAQTVQALAMADAASLQTRVQMLHPEWDEGQVTEEVDRIRADREPSPLTDPTQVVPASPDELAYMMQKIYLAVGTVITEEEARAILNRAGAGLTGPGPSADEPAGGTDPAGQPVG